MENTSLSFGEEALDTSKINTFELRIAMGSEANTIAFPPNLVWLDDESPDMSAVDTQYILAFRKYPGLENWIGNLQGSF